MKIRPLIIIFLFLLISSACSEKSKVTEAEKVVETQKNVPSQILPTATEVFHLRNECRKLADKILYENIIGKVLAQEQTSFYNPKNNRCFVELDVHTADLNLPEEKSIRSTYLYDGQTGELLAFADNKYGKKSGMSFKSNHIGYDAVIEYISDTMSDEDYYKKK